MQALPLRIDLEKAGRERGSGIAAESSWVSPRLYDARYSATAGDKGKSGDENKHGVVAGAKGTAVVILQQRQLVIAGDHP